LLKEANGAPTCAHGASEEGTHLQNGTAELIEGGEWLIVERLVLGYRDYCKNDCEEAGEARKGTYPIGYIGAETRRVGRMEEGT
jgi:hypothetical protein